jgi:YHS domain-containing protein
VAFAAMWGLGWFRRQSAKSVLSLGNAALGGTVMFAGLVYLWKNRKDAVTVVLEGMSDAKLNGTQVKFCCPKCEASFKADPKKYTDKMNEAIVKAAGAYALKNCVVMKDEALEPDAKTVVYQNRVYKLCCKKCVCRFEKDPAKYVKEYESQVIAAQKPAYKLATCPISGKTLGDGAVDMVLQGRLVRVCCAGCVGPVKADPAAAFAKIDAAK